MAAASGYRYDDQDSGRYSSSSSSCVSPTIAMAMAMHGDMPLASTPHKQLPPPLNGQGSLSPIPMYNNGALNDASFQRSGSVTRSMFERKPSERRNKLNSRLGNIDETHARRMSLDVREQALNEAADEAIKQVEQILRLRDACSELQEENRFLKEEVETLREAMNEQENEIDEKDTEIDELREYRKVLQDELEKSRRKLAQYRLQTERFKVENSVLSTSMNNLADIGADDEDEKQQLRLEKEAVSKELGEARRRIEELTRENENIRRSMRLAKERETATDERSKEDLLRVIRRSVEDKMTWEHYSSRLVSKLVAEAPHILDCNSVSVDTAAHCCHVESAWEGFALLLHKTMVEQTPELLNAMILEKDPRHKMSMRQSRSQIHTRNSQRGSGPGSGPGNSASYTVAMVTATTPPPVPPHKNSRAPRGGNTSSTNV